MAHFLQISPEFKLILDKKIAPIHRKSERVIALHQLLYNDKFFGIHYDNTDTKTAQQVLDTRSGNCLSLSALFISAARYVGLQAQFQRVQLPPQWEANANLSIYLGHVNVTVPIGGSHATVEFLDTYTAAQTSKYPSDKISDTEALARYYSNRGAELLARQQTQMAMPFLQHAIQTDRTLTDAWVNLGVAYKIQKDFSQAETAYLNALKIDAENPSANYNLQMLYSLLGRTEQANALAAKIYQHQLKNPYFHIKHGQQKLAAQDYVGALQHFNQAIKIQPEVSQFYALLAQTYDKLGRPKESATALQKSVHLGNPQTSIN